MLTNEEKKGILAQQVKALEVQRYHCDVQKLMNPGNVQVEAESNAKAAQIDKAILGLEAEIKKMEVVV